MLRRWVPFVVGLLLVAGFVRLGYWQLDRGAQKADMLADFEAAATAAPERLRRYRDRPRYTPVQLTGRYLDRPPIFHDNRLREGRPGVHVFVPFQPADGGPAVMVNLGWLPLGPRLELPDLPAVAPPATGLLAPPPAVGIQLGEPLPADAPPPWRVPHLLLEDAAARLNLTLAPQILLSTRDHPTYVREWHPASLPPERHRGYALQWFSLAAAVAALMLWGLIRLTRRTDD